MITPHEFSFLKKVCAHSAINSGQEKVLENVKNINIILEEIENNFVKKEKEEKK